MHSITSKELCSSEEDWSCKIEHNSLWPCLLQLQHWIVLPLVGLDHLCLWPIWKSNQWLLEIKTLSLPSFLPTKVKEKNCLFIPFVFTPVNRSSRCTCTVMIGGNPVIFDKSSVELQNNSFRTRPLLICNDFVSGRQDGQEVMKTLLLMCILTDTLLKWAIKNNCRKSISISNSCTFWKHVIFKFITPFIPLPIPARDICQMTDQISELGMYLGYGSQRKDHWFSETLLAFIIVSFPSFQLRCQ